MQWICIHTGRKLRMTRWLCQKTKVSVQREHSVEVFALPDAVCRSLRPRTSDFDEINYPLRPDRTRRHERGL